MTDKLITLSQDENEVNNGLVVVFRKPYSFEGKEYSEIDLSGIEKHERRTALCGA